MGRETKMKKSILSKKDHKTINKYIQSSGAPSSAHAELRYIVQYNYPQLIRDILAIETLIDHDSFLARRLQPFRHHSLRKIYATMVEENSQSSLGKANRR